MSTEQVNEREYNRIKDTLAEIASIEVLELIEQLEIVLEIRNLTEQIDDYRAVKEGK